MTKEHTSASSLKEKQDPSLTPVTSPNVPLSDTPTHTRPTGTIPKIILTPPEKGNQNPSLFEKLQQKIALSNKEIDQLKQLIEKDVDAVNQLSYAGVLLYTHQIISHFFPKSSAFAILYHKIQELNLNPPQSDYQQAKYVDSPRTPMVSTLFPGRGDLFHTPNTSFLDSNNSPNTEFKNTHIGYRNFAGDIVGNSTASNFTAGIDNSQSNFRCHSENFPQSNTNNANGIQNGTNFGDSQLANLSQFSTSVWGTTVTLQDALSAIPEFDGRNASFNNFMEGCFEAKAMIPPNAEPNLTRLIRNKLTGPAKNAIQGRIFNSVDNLLFYLQNLFSPIRSLAQIQGELGRLVQERKEPVIEYGNRARQLMIQILDAHARKGGIAWNFKAETEQETMECFARGLLKNININPRHFKNLDDIIIAAIRIEKENRARDELHYNQQTKFFPNAKLNVLNKIECKYCKKPGHTGDNCWEVHGYPTRMLTCAYCKHKGHDINECRKKKYFEKMRNKNSQNDFQKKISESGNEFRPSVQDAVPEEKGTKRISLIEQNQENVTETVVYTI